MSMALTNAVKKVAAENNELRLKLAELESRLARMENRKKPGPKPRNNDG